MRDPMEIDDPRRRLLYKYVEENGAVARETARRNVLVRPKTASKPARSGPELDPSVPMPPAEFDRHVAGLEDEGYLTVDDGTLRVAAPVGDDAETVALDGAEATVRPARQEDSAGIVDVVETVAGEDAYVVATRLAEEVDRDGALMRFNETEDRVFFVATVGEESAKGDTGEEGAEAAGETVVGWLHVGGVKAPKMHHTATLTMGVLADYRDHGLGAALLDRGLTWAREQGYRKVSQNLPATNEGAIDFLEAHGWTVEATREGQYLFGDDLVDEAQLAVWLDE
jgi:ribosomal protein S18 acetylase RimI-like enzyme